MKLKTLLLSAGVALGLAVGAASSFAAFPDRDIKIICGFAPGGTCDQMARLIAEATTRELGQNVVVENRTGAAGTIAMEAVARSAPDGHTMLLCAQGQMSMLPVLPGARVPIDPTRDLVPAVNAVLANYVMVVPASRPWQTVQDFVDHARANPGKLNYASTGAGTLQHLGGEAMRLAAQIDIVHVPYRGGAPAALDLIAGRVDVLFTNLADVIGHIRGGTVRLLAFTDSMGSPAYPQVPRMETIYPGFVVGGWFGLCAPAGTPAAAMQRWHQAMQRTMDNPQRRAQLAEAGLVLTIEGPDAFRTRVQQDIERLGATIRQAGIRAD